jgi:zinc/manganese transport system ATP-binding protein
VTAEKTTATKPAVAANATAGQDLLRLENIGVRLGGRQILSGVSFTVAPGQFTGLIGPNGAGKTTLLRVILGLQTPTEGRVLLNGSPRPRRGGRLIGYVPQKLAIDQDMPLRARDVVGLGIDGHKLGFALPSASRRRLVTEALQEVGAESYADARIGELSGGEQQRVLIAHALIGKPKLLLLDEPLANLDLKSERGIVSVLARLAREHQIAVLISAHDMNPLMRETDTVVYVAAGRAAAGRTDEVIRSEVLTALYGSHVDVLHVHGRVLVIAGDEQQEPQAHHATETGIVADLGRG